MQHFEIMSPFNDYITRRNVKNIMVGHFERYSFLFFHSRRKKKNLFDKIYIFVGHAIHKTKYKKKFFSIFLFLTWFGLVFLLHANVQATNEHLQVEINTLNW